MSRTLRLLALALLGCTSLLVHAQEGYVPLEQRLSSEQLRATGLDGLSVDQLRLLNTLLREDQALRAQVIRAEVERESTRSDREGGLFARNREPIASRIVGEFRGWTAGTRFRLDNGQTWRVIDTPEYYVPRSQAIAGPAVTLTPGLVGSWFLSVEGHSLRAKVQQVD